MLFDWEYDLMSNRNLKILAVVALAMIIWAVVQSKIANRPTMVTTLNTPLIQGLVTSNIDSVALSRGEDNATLKRREKKFVVKDKDNYPATTEKINNLMASILDIRVNELFTSNPENHEALEVTEENASSVVKFLDKEGKLLVGVVVGKRERERNITYVRRLVQDKTQSDKVYTSSNVPWLQTSAMSFIDKRLFKVTKKDISRVSVGGSDGTYRIKADENDKITVHKVIPEGKKLKGTDYENVFTAVTDLEFDDVQKESDKTADLKFDRVFVCELKDATIATFKLAEKDDKNYVKCEAEYTGDLNITKKDVTDASEEELKESEAKFLARDAAVDFTKKHKGWIYQISSGKAGNMTKKFSDLLEDKEEKKAEEKAEKTQEKKTD